MPHATRTKGPRSGDTTPVAAPLSPQNPRAP